MTEQQKGPTLFFQCFLTCSAVKHILCSTLVASLNIVCPLTQNLETAFASNRKEGLPIAISATLGCQSKVQA